MPRLLLARPRTRPRPLLAAALALTCAASLAACSSGASDDDAGSGATFPAAGDLTEASLEIAGGATSVTVVTGGTEGELFRTSAEGAEVTPLTTETGPGRYELDFELGETSSESAVTIHLDPEITWSLSFTGGAKTLTADLSGGQVAAIDFATGAETFDLTLPAPASAVAINQSGGAATFAVHLPADVAATVSFEQGVGSATVDGAPVSAESSTASVGDEAATERYVITNSGGLGAFTLDRTP